MKPFGIQTAYPNVLNFEGVKGLEKSVCPNEDIIRGAESGYIRDLVVGVAIGQCGSDDEDDRDVVFPKDPCGEIRLETLNADYFDVTKEKICLSESDFFSIRGSYDGGGLFFCLKYEKKLKF